MKDHALVRHNRMVSDAEHVLDAYASGHRDRVAVIGECERGAVRKGETRGRSLIKFCAFGPREHRSKEEPHVECFEIGAARCPL